MIAGDANAVVEGLLAMPTAEAAALLRRMTPRDQRSLDRNWAAWSRLPQRPPPGDWRIWLLMAGRGFGKTRAGAEWVNALANKRPGARIALVAATLDEARAVMVEGESGVLSVGEAHARPRFEPSLNRVRWRSGAIATLFSAEQPDGLRGPQHRYAWCDELAKWANPAETWSNLLLGLRDGENQRILVTTTPKPGRLLKRLIADPNVVKTGGSTVENLFLSPDFVEAVETEYAGTRLGAQELDGVMLSDAEGALWDKDMIARARDDRPLPAVAALARVVIGVDPPASVDGDLCGIVAAGMDHDGVGHILEDASVAGASPDRWARAVAACAARWDASLVIAEANNGGEMVRSVLEQSERNLPVRLVHATRGKGVRAEPVARLYERGRVRHHGELRALEAQLVALSLDGYQDRGSPDRADALVWALTELMLRRRAEPRIRVL